MRFQMNSWELSTLKQKISRNKPRKDTKNASNNSIIPQIIKKYKKIAKL
jgi:hypothetical protein